MTWLERAEAVTPGGAQTRSKRAGQFPWPAKFLANGCGARVWDTDGKEYIDWICGLGAISLGYRYMDVDRAVQYQLLRGVSYSLPTRLEVEVAEEACDFLQTEQVRFVKTGSEATEGAMRIARLATGRDTIISVGYHGWHTQHDAANLSHPGVPESVTQHVKRMEWGESPAYPCEPQHFSIAAVLLEPCRDDVPQPLYLQRWRQWCEETGTILIFDEMVTGFRWANRGASEYFDVKPDLVCYGKGMANGFPLACIAGPAKLMKHAEYVSGTFGGEALSLAAASATMDVFSNEPVVKSMWQTGEALMAEFNDLKGPVSMAGYPVHPRIVGSSKMEFIRAVAEQGVLFHPSGFNVSFSHREAEVKETIDACRRAMETLK